MIKDIEIVNKPRQCGKTTRLKQTALEEFIRGDFDSIIIVTHNETMKKYYQHWLENLHRPFNPSFDLYKGGIKVHSIFAEPFRELIRNNIDFQNKKCLIILDEPFIFPEERQTEIFRTLELYENTEFTIYGEGTLDEEPEKELFKDYL